jgi:hypothetical protein
MLTDDKIYNLALLMVAQDILKSVEHAAKSPQRHKAELEKTANLIDDYLSRCSEEEKKKVLEYYNIERKKTW